jgi:hypothetical protein
LAFLVFLPSLGSAAGHLGPQRQSWYGTLVFGYQDWSDVGDIQTSPAFPGEDFDSGGFNIEFSFHGPTPGFDSGRLMWGITTGIIGNESDVRGVYGGDELQLGMVYITPSIKFKLRDTRGQRIYLDFGAGFYAASIDEYDSYCYYWCYSTEYWDDDAFGGFIGLSADFDVGRPRGGYLNIGVKVHDVELSAPTEIGATENIGGPIVQFQVGMGFGGD